LFLSFGLPFFFLFSPFTFRDSIYKGRGSGIDPAPSHHCAWGAQFSCSVVAPREVANGGVACKAQLLCFLIMRLVASGFGSN
jgi:hypothetical protein